MKKVLTMKQIENQFSGEWVLLVNPEQSKESEIVVVVQFGFNDGST